MTIIFINDKQNAKGLPWASFDYREDFLSADGFVDIRRIVQENADAWLNDLNQSHAQLSATISQHTRWWWLSPLSRLDVRPWGSQEIFKPLFFARAILEWRTRNPESQCLHVLNAPATLALSLNDFDPALTIEGCSLFQAKLSVVSSWLKEKIIFKLKWFGQMGTVFMKNFSPTAKALIGEKLIIAERFQGTHTYEQAVKYYYGNIFDGMGNSAITFGIIDQMAKGFKPDRTAKDKFSLLSLLNFNQACCVAFQSIAFDCVMFFQSWKKRPCKIGNMPADKFWTRFLLRQYSKNVIIKEIAIFSVVRKLIAQNTINTIVYPYEEKGYERAILMATAGSKIQTIGFTPHPQHHLALSMKDGVNKGLKPQVYGVCGRAYVPFFENWGNKPKGSVHVWGSSKAGVTLHEQKTFNTKLRMLLCLSHPQELRVFASWLRALPALQKNKEYVVRSYKSVPDALFTKQIKDMGREFSCVLEDTGNFNADLNVCDIALFDATSAGIVAINAGKIAMHLCLDDLLFINPCFNQLDFMLSCASAKVFEDRLNELVTYDQNALTALWRKQYESALDIFSPVDRALIGKDLGC